MPIRKTNTHSVEERCGYSIIFEKRNKKDFKNYTSICLSNIYKVFTKVLSKRLEKTLDENQPREQAGFRSVESKNQNKEIHRKITAEWTAFAKHRDIFKGNTGTCLKRQIYILCVLLTMTYGAETWAFTTHAKNKLAAAHTKVERSMLNITYRTEKQTYG